ncbi:hypothetical protein GCM10023089_12110 [Quisquiliibacterium transsilvanicum]
MKDRIAVESRHAAPDDAGPPVNEGAERAVADERQIETGAIACSGWVSDDLQHDFLESGAIPAAGAVMRRWLFPVRGRLRHGTGLYSKHPAGGQSRWVRTLGAEFTSGRCSALLHASRPVCVACQAHRRDATATRR